MTKNNEAIFLYVMGWMACEPKVSIKFELKANTESRRKYAYALIKELRSRIGVFTAVLEYPHVWDASDKIELTVRAGYWSDRDVIRKLTETLKRKKVDFIVTEWR